MVSAPFYGTTAAARAQGPQGAVRPASLRTSNEAWPGPKLGSGVNWGNVVKGALIITAVVAVGVVAATAASSFVTAAAAAESGTVMATVGQGIQGLSNGAYFVIDTVGYYGGLAWTAVSNFTGGFLANIGFVSPLAAPAAQVATTTTAGVAAWGAGLGATLLAAPIAIKQFLSMPFLDPVSAGGTEHLVQAADTANHTTHHHYYPPQQPQYAQAPAGTQADHTAESMLDDAMQAATTAKASKMAYHAAEEHGEYQKAALAHTRQQNAAFRENTAQEWASKVGGPGKKMPQPIASRTQQSFAQNLEQDLAREEQQKLDGHRTH